MLFNTAWLNRPDKSDMLSTTNLVEWLEKQPAGGTYDYGSPYSCLLAKYFYNHGHRNVRIGTSCIMGDGYGDGLGATRIPTAFYTAVTPKPHTYGAALKRLKAVA